MIVAPGADIFILAELPGSLSLSRYITHHLLSQALECPKDFLSSLMTCLSGDSPDSAARKGNDNGGVSADSYPISIPPELT